MKSNDRRTMDGGASSFISQKSKLIYAFVFRSLHIGYQQILTINSSMYMNFIVYDWEHYRASRTLRNYDRFKSSLFTFLF